MLRKDDIIRHLIHFVTARLWRVQKFFLFDRLKRRLWERDADASIQLTSFSQIYCEPRRFRVWKVQYTRVHF